MTLETHKMILRFFKPGSYVLIVFNEHGLSLACKKDLYFDN